MRPFFFENTYDNKYETRRFFSAISLQRTKELRAFLSGGFMPIIDGADGSAFPWRFISNSEAVRIRLYSSVPASLR